MTALNSGIYYGSVHHCRFTPIKHSFSYQMALIAIDLDEVDELSRLGRIFASERWALLRFNPRDYLTRFTRLGAKATKLAINEPSAAALKRRVFNQIAELGADKPCDRVLFVGQIRHFGLYFSPVNFYFCYKNQMPLYMLAEVSNTPWNERHCYLVDLTTKAPSDKVFHVSPFMDLNMRYLWQVSPPGDSLRISIENNRLLTEGGLSAQGTSAKSVGGAIVNSAMLNSAMANSIMANSAMVNGAIANSAGIDEGAIASKGMPQDDARRALVPPKGQKLFNATLTMQRQAVSAANLRTLLLRCPFMTLKIVLGIYWQALMLLVKRVPFVPYPAQMEK
ncbi:MAG: DUF1365 domain-containing protein [Shewanella sp.]